MVANYIDKCRALTVAYQLAYRPAPKVHFAPTSEATRNSFLIDGAAGAGKTNTMDCLRETSSGRQIVAVVRKYTTHEHRAEEIIRSFSRFGICHQALIRGLEDKPHLRFYEYGDVPKLVKRFK